MRCGTLTALLRCYKYLVGCHVALSIRPIWTRDTMVLWSGFGFDMKLQFLGKMSATESLVIRCMI